MMAGLETGLLTILRTFNQILSAVVAITAFSLLLYTLTFNLRDRVVRSFAFILFCVVIVFTTETIGSMAIRSWEIEFWFRTEWVGIILLPAVYLHFSDCLLATTGKPSQWKRWLLIRAVYLFSIFLIMCLPTSLFFKPFVEGQSPVPFLQSTIISQAFALFYLVVMGLSWYNFYRAYRRTTTPTSRRRMFYLIIGALAPALGSFPYMVFGSGFAVQHPLIFWLFGITNNILVGGFIIVMAYSVAFFGVSWPDRVVRMRLFKWLLRGPTTAGVTLALVTIVRRLGEIFGITYSALVPITMAISILICQYVITILNPLGQRWLFYARDRNDYELIHNLDDRLITRNDLHQYLELILAAICDRLQAAGAYIVELTPNGIDMVVTIGKTRFSSEEHNEDLLLEVTENDDLDDVFKWGEDYLSPLRVEKETGNLVLVGLLGVTGLKTTDLDSDQKQALSLLSHRAMLALDEHQTQQSLLRSLRGLSPEVEMIQRLGASSRADSSRLLLENGSPTEDMSQWVKEALTHYWGGPKFMESPLMKLLIVRDSVDEHEGSYANALRAILQEAINKVRPEGERRFTGEWILYNILEMKFLEGRKVREIALRLAMSEADLYRKQRVAVEAVAKAIVEMEEHHKNGL